MGQGTTNEAEKLSLLEDFDRSLGTDELNLAEFPLHSLSTRSSPGQNTLLFEDRIFDEGSQTPIDRSLVIAGSDHFGLPTSTDSDILLMLIHLTKVRNGFKDKRVNFTRYELVRFLGWDEGGRSYRRLDEALQRWTSVTLHYKHAWWDRSGRKWRTRSFHVIESLELRGKDEVLDDGPSTFTWNNVIFDSFKAGNLKRLDLNTYFSLHHSVAKQLYRFLDKRFYRSSRLDFSLTELACEHIGLARNYDTYELKRKLQPAIEELESIGFLRHEPVSRRYVKLRAGEWRIVFRRACAELEEKPESGDIVQELTRRGISRPVAEQLSSEFPESKLSEKIAIHDELLERRDPRISRNPAGFLAAAIRGDYQLPVDVKAGKRELRSSETRKKKPLAAKPAAPVRDKTQILLEATQEYFAKLTPEEQAIVESNAVARGNRFQVESYNRLKASGGKLFHGVRMDLIAKYLESEQVFTSAQPSAVGQG